MIEWRVRENELISYTGMGGDIKVPSKISYTSIDTINDYALSPKKKGLNISVADRRYDIQSAIIQSGIRYIGKSAFEGCFKLKKVVFPKSIKTIESRAFAHTGLESVEIPSRCRFSEYDSDQIFAYCHNLKCVVISDGIRQMPDEMFMGCEELSEITLPKELKKIPNGFFKGCSNLKHVIIPETVEKIGSSAFQNSGMEDIIIPENVRSISSDAFKECKSLKRIIFKSKHKSAFPELNFKGCKVLEEIEVPNKIHDYILRHYSDYCKEHITIVSSDIEPDLSLPEDIGFWEAKELLKWLLQSEDNSYIECALSDQENNRKNGNEEGEDIQAKKKLIVWLSKPIVLRDLKILLENYSKTICDDELIDAFLTDLKIGHGEDWNNIIAFYFSLILKKSEPTEKVKEAYKYLRNMVVRDHICDSEYKDWEEAISQIEYKMPDSNDSFEEIAYQSSLNLFANYADYFDDED